MPFRTALPFALLIAAPALAAEAPGGEPMTEATRCLAEAVYFEARGTGAESRAAIAHVVVNRALSSEFPDTICEVVDEGCQFSYNCDGEPEALDNPESRNNALATARAVLADERSDPTGGALFFHNRAVAPDWSGDFEPTAEIGDHIFYRPTESVTD